MALEKPNYQVVKKDGRFEIRRYDSFITSQVIVEADTYRDAASIGFSPLANYIFGANVTKQKLPMTAPVSAQPQSEKISMTAPVSVSGNETYTVSFVIPKKYSLETLPEPVDKRIHFVEHPPQTIAAIRFSGPFQQRNFNRNLLLLKEWLENKNITVTGEPIIAGYNAPFVPFFLKHNEVLIPIMDA